MSYIDYVTSQLDTVFITSALQNVSNARDRVRYVLNYKS